MNEFFMLNDGMNKILIKNYDGDCTYYHWDEMPIECKGNAICQYCKDGIKGYVRYFFTLANDEILVVSIKLAKPLLKYLSKAKFPQGTYKFIINMTRQMGRYPIKEYDIMIKYDVERAKTVDEIRSIIKKER